MKLTAIAGLCLIAAGCATRSSTSVSQWPAPHPYLEEDLALTLTQESHSFDLVLTLKNTSSQPITNRFAEARFEGVIWVFQEDAVPLQAWPSNYFNLAIHALWTNPLRVIAPGEGLTYHVPLASLQSRFSTRQPDPRQPAFAYAFLHKYEVSSNTIRLEKPERIQWRTIKGVLLRSAPERGRGSELGGEATQRASDATGI